MARVLVAILSLTFISTLGFAGDVIRMKNETLSPQTAVQSAQIKSGGFVKASPARFTPTLGRVYYILQFAGPVHNEWKQALTKGGVEIGSYLPEDAFLIRVSKPDSWNTINNLQVVRAVIPYKSSLRVSHDFEAVMALDGGTSNQKVIVKLAFADEASNVMNVASQRGLTFVLDEASDRTLVVETRADQVQKLADIEGVEWIEPLPEIQTMDFDMSTTAQATPPGAGDYTDLTGYESGTKIMNFDAAYAKGLHGEGETVGIADTGLDRGSMTDLLDDFKTSLLKGYALGLFEKNWGDPNGHGTHTSGSIAGTGALSGGKLHGGAYGAKLVMQSMWSPMLKNLSIIPDFDKIFGSVRRTDDVHIHSNSWGSPRNYGQYDSLAQQVDELSWNYPDLLIVFAAGNEGVDDNKDGRIDENSIGTPATAKDCLTVGASKNLLLVGGIQRPMNQLRDGDKHWAVEPIASSKLSDNANGIAAFSSRGPTMDGRIKPEIVAPGTNIISTRSLNPEATPLWGPYNDYYVYAGGTSMATPLTAGAAAVVRQNLRANGFADPSAALIKAVMLHSATDLFPGEFPLGKTQEFLTTRPNVDEGFGRVDLNKGTTLANYQLVDETHGLKTGESKEYEINADKGSVVHATLVYTDAPAAASSAKALVNSLELSVVDGSGQTHYPNHLKGPDRINNSQTVEFNASAGGRYTVIVNAHSVPHGRDATGAQPFALVLK